MFFIVVIIMLIILIPILLLIIFIIIIININKTMQNNSMQFISAHFSSTQQINTYIHLCVYIHIHVCM